MSTLHEAESRFHDGMRLLSAGKPKEAIASLGAAIEIQKRAGVVTAQQARYLSYYGMCLFLSRRAPADALRACRTAVELDSYSHEAWWNLARVALSMGRRAEAHTAVCRGLKLDPSHKGLRGTLQRMGIRRRPVLPFLSRSHPINTLLGQIGSSRPRQASPARA